MLGGLRWACLILAVNSFYLHGESPKKIAKRGLAFCDKLYILGMSQTRSANYE